MTRPPLPLAFALEQARAFAALLDGTYERLEIAGSIRRRAPTVGDIEIVASPAYRPQVDLFGTITSQVDLLDQRLQELSGSGLVGRRVMADGSVRWGPRTKYLWFPAAIGDDPYALLPDGVAVDVFVCEPERFGWLLALRTGPAAFSRQLVQPAELITRDGRPGLMPPTRRAKGGWLVDRTSGARVPTPDEADAFRELGIEYREPWERR